MSTVTKSIAAFALCLMMAVPALGQNVSVSDYQVPVSSARKLLVNGSYNWQGTKDVPQTNSFHSDVLFSSFYSSLPFAWFLDASGAADHSLGVDWTTQGHVSGEVRKYIFDNQDWFASGRLTVDHQTGYAQPDMNARAAGGYGRYINATALAKAVRIEELLMKENVLKDHMPKETMIKIANIIERESEYQDTYGTTYEVQWFADIEKEAKSSGSLVGDGLGAIGLFRIREVLFPGQVGSPPVNTRYYGWDASAGVEFQVMEPHKLDVKKPALSLAANYAYPIDWSMQVNGGVEANTPVDSNFFKRVDVKGHIDYLYELSNRINFTSNYSVLYQKVPNIDALTTHQLNASFLFYIENSINYVVTGSISKTGQLDAVMGLSMSLQYRLLY